MTICVRCNYLSLFVISFSYVYEYPITNNTQRLWGPVPSLSRITPSQSSCWFCLWLYGHLWGEGPDEVCALGCLVKGCHLSGILVGHIHRPMHGTLVRPRNSFNLMQLTFFIIKNNTHQSNQSACQFHHDIYLI